LKVEGEGKKAFGRAPWKTCSVIRGRGNRQKPAPLKAKGAAPGPKIASIVVARITFLARNLGTQTLLEISYQLQEKFKVSPTGRHGI